MLTQDVRRGRSWTRNRPSGGQYCARFCSGGIPFGRGALSHFLRNRFFIGEVKYKGEVLPGAQPAIMDTSPFEAVQQKLSAQRSHNTLTRQKSEHLLKDLLFDDAGHRMVATHATKAGVRYRYYVSRPGLHGAARTAEPGSIVRVPAPGIEQAIISALQTYLAETKLQRGLNDAPISFDRAALAALLSRIEVRRNQLVGSLRPSEDSTEPAVFAIPWQRPSSTLQNRAQY